MSPVWLLLVGACNGAELERPPGTFSGGANATRPEGSGPGDQDGQGPGQQCSDLEVSCPDPQAPVCCDRPEGLPRPGCTRILEDPFNCGECGRVCPGRAGCVQGECAASACADVEPCTDPERPVCCDRPFGGQGAGCTAIFQDPFNCGGCGIVCETGAGCQFGFCGPL
ncbi:MAG: hypothetical protein HYY06_31585 [Deltaproteobacteria bacterium]|nr:hypothetical protein [Deltaproteobacteria bacterium]